MSILTKRGRRLAWICFESRLGGTRQVNPLLQTEFDEKNGVVSPDGRWLAYEYNRSDSFEVYVRPFPNGAVRSKFRRKAVQGLSGRPMARKSSKAIKVRRCPSGEGARLERVILYPRRSKLPASERSPPLPPPPGSPRGRQPYLRTSVTRLSMACRKLR